MRARGAEEARERRVVGSKGGFRWGGDLALEPAAAIAAFDDRLGLVGGDGRVVVVVVDPRGKGGGALARAPGHADGVERFAEGRGARRKADVDPHGKGVVDVAQTDRRGRVAKVRGQKADGAEEVVDVREVKVVIERALQVLVGQRRRRPGGVGEDHGAAGRAELGKRR